MQYLYKHYPIHCDSNKKTIAKLEDHLQSKRGFLPIVTLNLLMKLELSHHQSLNQWIQKHAYITIDGISIAIILSMLTKRIIRRYPGIDMTVDLLTSTQGYRLALIGGQPHVLKKACKHLQQAYPQHTIVFTHDGYSNISSKKIMHLANQQPDITMVAMGCPKQEQLLQQLNETMTTGIGIGIGGTFDIWSGEKKRAPKFMRRLGLEWMYRIIEEPSRINRWIACLNKSGFPNSAPQD